MSILSKLNILKKEDSSLEETSTDKPTTEETPTDETPPAETPTEEAPPAETPTEETPPAETPTEEAPPAETPTEEAPTSDEPPAEEATAEETPTDESEKKDWFLTVLNFFKANKFVHEVFMIFCVVALFFMAVLSYGEFTKQEGIPSFETFHAEHTGKKIATLFTKGDMEGLLSYLYVDTPSYGINKESQQTLCTKTAKQLEKEYEKLFSELPLSVSKADAIYQLQDSGEVQVIITCHIAISEKVEILLTLKQHAKNQYTMSLSTDDRKDEKSFHKINALFAYASNAYTSKTDEYIAYTFTSGDKKALASISNYFYSNPNKEDNKTYSKELAIRLKTLPDLNITITQAFIEPYTYDKKNNQKTSSLTLRCVDKETGETFVYYQPLIIGLYGYEANGSCSIYGNNIRPEVYNRFSLLFLEI